MSDIPAVYDTGWKRELHALIERARKEGKWLFTHNMATGKLWLSPDQLATENQNGRFMWGVFNWQLRDPAEYLAEADRAVALAVSERNRVAQDIAGVAAGRSASGIDQMFAGFKGETDAARQEGK